VSTLYTLNKKNQIFIFSKKSWFLSTLMSPCAWFSWKLCKIIIVNTWQTFPWSFYSLNKKGPNVLKKLCLCGVPQNHSSKSHNLFHKARTKNLKEISIFMIVLQSVVLCILQWSLFSQKSWDVITNNLYENATTAISVLM